MGSLHLPAARHCCKPLHRRGADRSHGAEEASRMYGAERGVDLFMGRVPQRPMNKSMAFIDRITDFLSKKMVRKIKNRWGYEIWLWDRDEFKKVETK